MQSSNSHRILPNNTTLQNGKYVILRYLASGGFGCTYFGENKALGIKVAIKEFFISDFCGRTSDGRVTLTSEPKREVVAKLKAKFIEEARAIAQMDHQGIVKIYDVFEENDTAYYVMEYIDGFTLADLIKNGPLSEQDALLFIDDVAQALSYVHSKGRLHLDIKPANIMLTSNGRVKLIDFGVSKQFDADLGAKTSTLLGMTPGYAAIEQINNNTKLLRPATDVYALGATLYALLTGEAPLAVSDRAAGMPIKPLPANVSQRTRQALEAALSIGVNDRPASVNEFITMLKGAKDPNPSQPRHTVPVSQKPQAPATVPAAPADQPTVNQLSKQKQKPKSKPSLKKWIIPVSIVGVLALVVAIVFFFKGGDVPFDDNRTNYEIGRDLTLEHKYQKAIPYFEKAIAEGNLDSYHFLIKIYALDLNDDDKENKYINEYMQKLINLASAGNKDAMYRLGVIYLESTFSKYGKSYEKNDSGKVLLEKLVAEKYPDACYKVGKYMLIGLHKFPLDKEKAFELFKEADRGGSGDASYMLYKIYNGREYIPSVEKDENAACNYVRRAAERGCTDAFAPMGIECRFGHHSIPKNYKEAIDWIEKSITKNGENKYLSSSQEVSVKDGSYELLNIAEMYAEGGYGIEKDTKKAIEYYNKIIEDSYDEYYISTAKKGIEKLQNENK